MEKSEIEKNPFDKMIEAERRESDPFGGAVLFMYILFVWLPGSFVDEKWNWSCFAGGGIVFLIIIRLMYIIKKDL